ncbi:hypothetical protein CL618_02355, partial [archaeon]|nr:hypothetical protein [archaeon]
DYLSDKEGTETEISRELKIPMSTVHYNIQQLIKAGLVKNEEYEYSEKGREVNFYKLAKKMIIIGTDDVKLFKKDIVKILPVGLIGVIAGGLMYWFSRVSVVMEAAPLAGDMLKGSFAESRLVSETVLGNFNYLWFIYGVLFYMVLFLVYSYVLNKITSK